MLKNKKFGFTVNELLLTIIVIVSIVFIFLGNIKAEDELQEKIKSLKAEGSAESLMKAKILSSSSDYAKSKEALSNMAESEKRFLLSENRVLRKRSISQIKHAFTMQFALEGKFIPIDENLHNIFSKHVNIVAPQKNGSLMDAHNSCYKFTGNMTCGVNDSCFVWVDVNCAKGPNVDGIDIMNIPFVVNENGEFVLDVEKEAAYSEDLKTLPVEFDEFAQQKAEEQTKEFVSSILSGNDSFQEQEFNTAKKKMISSFKQASTMEYALVGKTTPTLQNIMSVMKNRARGTEINSNTLKFMDGTCMTFNVDGICSSNGNCSVKFDANCNEKPNKDGADIMTIPLYNKDGVLSLDDKVANSYTILNKDGIDEYSYK